MKDYTTSLTHTNPSPESEAPVTSPSPKPYPNPEVIRECHFCHKPKSDVKILIASDKASICNECVVVCMEIIIDGFHDRRPDK